MISRKNSKSNTDEIRSWLRFDPAQKRSKTSPEKTLLLLDHVLLEDVSRTLTF